MLFIHINLKGFDMLSNNLTNSLDLIPPMIDKGNAFRAFTELVIPDSGEVSLSVKAGDNVAMLYNRTISTDQPKIRYEVRLGATTTITGDPVTIFPANPKLIKQTGLVVAPCSYTDAGSLSDIDIIAGQAASGSNKGGETFSPSEIKPIPENTETLIIFKNPNNQVCKVLLYFKWFELGANSWEQ